ncbi:MAG TPA: hypothetical protein VFG44_07015 [Burkholderiales bacterium]|nr:hypothetical protein [Burkholderiales bacterium]
MLSSITRLILLLALLSLTGCTAILRPVLHLALAANPVPIWGASPNVGASGKTITWHSNVPGRFEYSGPRFDTAGVIDEGSYARWNWSIRAPSDVQQSYTLWAVSGGELAQTYGVAYDWQSGMRQLYSLSTYLLGVEPASLRAGVLLVPKGDSFDEQSTEPIGDPTALTIAVPFTTSTKTTKAAQVERFSDMRP